MGWTVRSWHEADVLTKLKVRWERGAEVAYYLLWHSRLGIPLNMAYSCVGNI